MKKPWTLAIFQYISPGGTVGASWRHPDDSSARFTDLDHWISLAQKFESAGFDFLFFADSYGYPVHDGAPIAAAVREARGIPQGDPVPLIAALAAATTELGFVVTASTTVEAPAANARRFSTLDHFTKGRVGWNVVTGASGDTAAALMGKPLIPHDVRYDMADDFLDVSLKLWEGSWDEGALVRDKAAGVYADPAKVRVVHHDGPYFQTHGLLNLPPSPQRTPVIVQAGASGRGKEFAGRNAEVVFLGGGDPAVVENNVRGIREAALAAGRPEDAITVLVGALFLVGPTGADAEATRDTMVAMSTNEGAAAIYQGNTGIDLLALDPTKPLPTTTTQTGQGNVDRFAPQGGKPAPTAGEILENFRRTGINGSVFVGAAEEVADQASAFLEATGADGFLVQPHLTPGTYDDFIEYLLPVLRERNLVGLPNRGPATLRERLGGISPHLQAPHRGAAFRMDADVTSDNSGTVNPTAPFGPAKGE